MNEDYVSLEVAKLLKEKGFDEITTKAYNPIHNYLETYNANYEQIPFGYYLAPTLYMAQKWLRSRGYHVEVSYTNDDLWIYEILTIPYHDLVGLSDRIPTCYMSYEYALQAGILEALKLI